MKNDINTFRVGIGEDLHRLEAGRLLWLGGIAIDSPVGTIAHSDGDVVCHALIDAMLGAAALGDIGEHFPDTDPAYCNASGLDLLTTALQKISNAGYQLHNLDVTIKLEAPKLKPYKLLIRTRLAETLQLPLEAVSVKAKTNEGLDAIGQQQAIAATAIVLLTSIVKIDKFL